MLEACKCGADECKTKWRSVEEVFHQSEEVECFKYLDSQVAADGGCESDVVHRMNEGFKAWGAMKSVLCNRGLGINAKKCLYEGVIVPTVLYGAEHGA